MNKRILKLFNEAGFHQPEMERLRLEDKFERFAEFIVKEAGEYLMRPEFIGRSDLDWSMILNEHFGVEQ